MPPRSRPSASRTASSSSCTLPPGVNLHRAESPGPILLGARPPGCRLPAAARAPPPSKTPSPSPRHRRSPFSAAPSRNPPQGIALVDHNGNILHINAPACGSPQLLPPKAALWKAILADPVKAWLRRQLAPEPAPGEPMQIEAGQRPDPSPSAPPRLPTTATSSSFPGEQSERKSRPPSLSRRLANAKPKSSTGSAGQEQWRNRHDPRHQPRTRRQNTSGWSSRKSRSTRAWPPRCGSRSCSWIRAEAVPAGPDPARSLSAAWRREIKTLAKIRGGRHPKRAPHHAEARV